MTEYRRRADTIDAIQLTDTNAADVVAFSGAILQDDGSLMLPNEPGTLEVGDFIDRNGTMYDAESFSQQWVEVTDGPTLTERVAALEARLA